MDNHFIILISIITFGFIVLVLFSVNNFITTASQSRVVANNTPNTISVSATGSAEGAPNELTIVLSVKSTDSSSQKAVSELAAEASSVINTLKQFSTESVETSSYSLYQNTYCPPECQPTLQPLQATTQPIASNVSSNYILPICKPCISNGTYEASEEITIKTLNLSSGGSIIDAAVNAGADSVQSVSFDFSSQESNLLSLQALNDSITKAMQKAQTIASDLNLKITGVQSVNLNNYYYPQPFVLSAEMTAASNSPSTQILPENQTVTANVDVVFTTN